MNYVDFTAGNKEYKLRLSTRNVVVLEKALGCNPLMIFGAGDGMPTVTNMVQILHAALQQYQHKITLDDAYEIFDDYIADDHTHMDFVHVILDIYRASGLLKAEKEEDESEKNA